MPPTLPALDTLLDLLPDAVWIVDQDGHFLFVGAAFQRIFGYSPDEVIGRRMLDLVHPDDRATTVQAARRVMQGLRPGDLAARVGGDEFVALLPDCDDVPRVQAIAAGLEERLQGLGSDLDAAMRIGASIGLACHPGDGDSPDALLRSADRAMYAIKAARVTRLR